MMPCLHGAVGSWRDWNRLQEDSAFPVLPVDLWRLFDAGNPSLAEAGRIIADQAHDGDILLGYSMGARLALHALLADPAKWRAAILVSAHPGLTEGQATRRAADEKWAAQALRDWPRFLTRWNQQEILAGAPEGLHQAPPSEQKAVAQSFRSWSLGTQADLRPRLPEIPCPVLWLTGESDLKFTALAREVVPLFPHAEHRILPSCGHRLPWEEPLLFCNHVEQFLGQTRKPTRS